MIHGILPDYPDQPPKPRRDALLDIKAEIESEIAKGGTADELEELQFQLDAVCEELDGSGVGEPEWDKLKIW